MLPTKRTPPATVTARSEKNDRSLGGRSVDRASSFERVSSLLDARSVGLMVPHHEHGVREGPGEPGDGGGNALVVAEITCDHGHVVAREVTVARLVNAVFR